MNVGSIEEEEAAASLKPSSKRDENIYDNCNVNAVPPFIATTSNNPQLTASQHDKDKFVCPFVGLPAAHLKIMNSPKYGLLYRIEKKIFFDQTKHYYAGVMNRWVLLYSANSNDMKPNLCLYVEDVGVDTVFDSNGKRRENWFHVVTNTGKRYQFQALSVDDMNEWITVINQHIIDDKNSTLDEKVTNLRKLPTLPTNSPIYDQSVYQNQRQSIKSEERIYEEPSNISPSPTQDEEMKEKSASHENCYDVVSFNAENNDDIEKPPDLPVKTGKKTTKKKHDYDIPKSTTKPAKDSEEDNDNVDSKASIADVESSPIKSDVRGIKVSEVKAILSTQKLPISPMAMEENHKRQKVVIREEPKENRTPVKSWFLRQINKSGEKSKSKKASKNNQRLSTESNNASPESLTKTVKGGKVNMIISQLEANGQLQILSKSLRDRKSLVFDAEEYEPVNIKDNNV